MNTTPKNEKPIIPASAIELADEAYRLLTNAKDFIIENKDHYEVAALDLKAIKNKMRSLEDQRKDITRPIDIAKKSVMDFFRKPTGFLKDSERILKRSMLNYQDEKDREAHETEMRLKKNQAAEQERLAREAEKAEEAGDIETANAIIEHAAMIPDSIIAKEIPAVPGIKTSMRWSAELISKDALIKAVASGQIPDVAIDVNMRFLNQQAVSLKSAFDIPGVKAVTTKSIAA